MAEPPTRGRTATRAEDHPALNDYHLTEKNTFLHVAPPFMQSVQGLTYMRRQTSAPASTSASSRSTSRDSKSSSTLGKLDQLLLSRHRSGNEELNTADTGDNDFDDDDNSEEAFDMSSTGAGESASRKDRKSKRPCKSQRTRYRNLVAKLEEKVREDPNNFDLSKVELPQFLNDNQRLLSKLDSRLLKLAEQVRAGGGGRRGPLPPGGPGASAGSSSGSRQPLPPGPLPPGAVTRGQLGSEMKMSL